MGASLPLRADPVQAGDHMGGGPAHPTMIRISPLKMFEHVCGQSMMFSGFMGLS
jgi:hypothetical protein